MLLDCTTITFAAAIPEIATTGVIPSKRSVSLHSLMNATMNPPKKTVLHWMKKDSSSPIPS